MGRKMPIIVREPSMDREMPIIVREHIQFGHVGVGVAVAHGLAQTHAVDDRRMVQRVGDNGVLLTENRFEDAGGVEDRVLGAEVVGYGFFELFVDVLTAADETHRRHAVAAVVRSKRCIKTICLM